MNIHFIAIGGAAMHNLALALKNTGHTVTGSDDEIFEPSKTRLANAGLLPNEMGWHPENITTDLDAVILGMHAREDNPELKKAQELGLRIYSYPEFVYEQSKDKLRVVIAGSHGKTTITAMVLHVLKKLGKKFDYLVGAQLEGFDTMVKLSDAPLIVLEGDEYLSSPIDRRPKFHLYRPQIALISGIAWDHINVFPTWEMYQDQFRQFIHLMPADGHLVYCRQDKLLNEMVNAEAFPENRMPYGTPVHVITDGVTHLVEENDGKIPLEIFGEHNLQNLNGARYICGLLGISGHDFNRAVQSFHGAARRLERIAKTENTSVYKDFAHSPSKLKATVKAVKRQWKNRKLVACMELHTFSSLNKQFLKQYYRSMWVADKAIVFFNRETIEHKKMEMLDEQMIKDAFGRQDLKVFTDPESLKKHLKTIDWKGKNLLLMSSGNFGGIKVDEFARELVGQGF